jgi:hypothetical protein
MDLSTIVTFAFPIVALVMVAFFLLRPGRRARTLICTRCDGSGQVAERWPDPSQPGGWHDLHGVCPKCGGVGKV